MDFMLNMYLKSASILAASQPRSLAVWIAAASIALFLEFCPFPRKIYLLFQEKTLIFWATPSSNFVLFPQARVKDCL